MTDTTMIRGMKTMVPAVLVVGALAMLACGGGPEAGFPDTPDETVRYMAEQLGDQHPEVVWEAMPPSWREDVTELVHGFAEKTDPEVYDKGFDLARKLSKVLREKKDIFLGSSALDEMTAEDRKKLRENWDVFVGMLDTVVNSELGSLDEMRTIDIGDFLTDTGTALMRQSAEASAVVEEDPYNAEFETKLAQLQVEAVSVTGDTALLRLTVPEEPIHEVPMVRVEDRWVPKAMADRWDSEVAEARARLDALDENKSEMKLQMMMMMGMAEAFLDQIAAVETSEELDNLMKGMVGGLLRGGR